MYRLLPLYCILAVYGYSAVPPKPQKGEYGCIQLNVVPALPLPGLPPTTQVTSAPSPIGNLILDGTGRYQTTVGRHNGTYRYDDATGRVSFTGVLQPLSVNYGARGSTLYFEFRDKGISFTCSAKGSQEYGDTRARTATAVNEGFTGQIYYAGAGGVYRIDLATGQQTSIGLSDNFDVRQDGSAVYVNKLGEMILTNVQGQGSARVPVYGSKNYSPRVSPDGSKIAYYGMQKPRGLESAMMAAYSLANLEPLVVSRDGQIVAAFGTPYGAPAWTPDGRIVVAGSKSSNAQAINAGTGLFISDPSLRRLTKLPLDFDAPRHPAVSPDGSKLAFSNGSLIWVSNIDGSNPRKVYQGSTPYVMYPAWSPDGRALTFIDNQVLGIVSLDGKELAVKDADGRIIRSNSELLWRR